MFWCERRCAVSSWTTDSIDSDQACSLEYPLLAGGANFKVLAISTNYRWVHRWVQGICLLFNFSTVRSINHHACGDPPGSSVSGESAAETAAGNSDRPVHGPVCHLFWLGENRARFMAIIVATSERLVSLMCGSKKSASIYIMVIIHWLSLLRPASPRGPI